MKKIFLSLMMIYVMLCGFLYMAVPVYAVESGAVIDENDEIPLRLYYDEEASHGVNQGFEEMPESSGAWSEYVTINANDDWERWSIPIGNGYFGANLFGRTDTERIQLTDKTMQNPYLSEDTSLGGLNNFSETYIDFGHKNENVTNYSRELDLKTAVSTVAYTYDGVDYEREYFASYPDNALIIRLNASEEGALNFVLRPTVPYEQEYARAEGDRAGKTGTVTSSVNENVGEIILSGKMEYYDVDFAGIYKVYTNGTGEISATDCTNADGDTDGTITVSGAKTAYIIATLGTDYVLSPEIFTKPDLEKPTFRTDLSYTMNVVGDRMTAVTSQLSGKSVNEWYEALKSRHMADYQNLFGRVTLNLACKESDYVLTTDQLLENYKGGSGSTYLETLYFQYGRYLLIASSREGALPANLQGTWNRYNFSPWSSGYWHNINVQMNYWPAFSTNLAETFIPYFDYNTAYMSCAEQAADNIVKDYTPELDGADGGNGWTIGTGCKPFSIDTSRLSGDLGLTTQLFWDYYRFTGDKKYLEEKIYPVLASAARYITKSVKLQEDGTYLVFNSPSPEQFAPGTTSWYFTDGPTYAQSAAYMNNYYCLQAARELGIDLTDDDVLAQEEYKILKTVLDQIDKYDPIVVGLSGQVKEFREEEYYGEIGEYKHRHISQLIGLYPGDIINSTTPAWLDAAKVTLTERGDEATGWGVAHRLNLWARTKDGNRTYSLVQQMLKKNTATNLWDLHPPFQIDGNLGATAGIAEMLLQSHEGYIEPLPAIPDDWASGSYTGLKARGNFEVAAKWENGCAVSFNIKSIDGNSVSLSYFGIENADVFRASDGTAVSYEVIDDNIIRFDTVKGETYIISNIGAQKKLPAPSEVSAKYKYLDAISIHWSAVAGAASYNVYVAVENAPDYTLFKNTKDLSCDYSPAESDINARFTFKVTPVSNDGIKGAGKVCYQNPVDLSLEINAYSAVIIDEKELQVTIDATSVTKSYRLWKKVKGAADFTLVSESDYPIVVDSAYAAETSYGISLVGLYGSETQVTPITKFTTTGGEGEGELPEYRRNFLTDYTFTGADDAFGYVLNNMGYSRLTDGKHKVDSDHITYRFATIDTADAYMDGTVAFDKEFLLDELRLYDYDQSSATTTRAGETMDVYIMQNGEWIKAKSFVSSAELIAARKFDTEYNTYYTAVDLNGYIATAIRIVCRNVTSTKGITFFEIECSGAAISAPSVTDTRNVLSGLSPKSCTADTGFLPDCGVDKLTDGDFDVNSGRLAVNDGENNVLSLTYDLGRTYFLNEIKIYEYVGEFSDPDVKESKSNCSETTIELYQYGEWVTVMDAESLWSAESELVEDNDGKYVSISFDGNSVSKLRMSFKNTNNSNGISLNEIQCIAGISTLELPNSNAFDNYVSISQTGVSGIYSSSYKLENALDGDMSTRFALKDEPVKNFYIEIELSTEKPLFNLIIYDFSDYKDVIDGILTSRSDNTYVELYTNGAWLRVADGIELDVTDNITEFYLYGIVASKIRVGFSSPEFTVESVYHHASVYEMTCSTAAANPPNRSKLLEAYKSLFDSGIADRLQYTEKMSIFKSYAADTDADQETIDMYTQEITTFVAWVKAFPEGTFQIEFETMAERAGISNVQKVINPANPGDMSTKYASEESFWGNTGTQTDPSTIFTFTAPEAGYYEVYYALGNAGANTTDLSPVSLTVNDELIGDNIKNNIQIEDLSQYQDNGDGTKKRVYPWQYMEMMLFKGSSACYLHAGENNLKVEVTKSGGNVPAFKFFADYIRFIPVQEEVVTTDDSLTRIKFSSPVKIKASVPASFVFTVPKDGNYAFMANRNIDYSDGTITATVKEQGSEEEIEVCTNANWSAAVSGQKLYARVGVGTTGTVALKANVPYIFTITSSVGFTTSYFDAICTDINVNGKILIPSHYYTITNQNSDHFLNNFDLANSMKTTIPAKFPEYSVIGQSGTDQLIEQQYAVPISVLISKMEGYLEYTLDIPKKGQYAFQVYASVYSSDQTAYPETVYFSVDGTEKGAVQYAPSSWADREKILTFRTELSAGRHQLRISRTQIGDESSQNLYMYIPFLTAEPIKPTAAMYLGSVAEENEISFVQSGDLIAKIETNGAVPSGQKTMAFFAIYDNEKQLVRVERKIGELSEPSITLTIKNFVAEEGKSYKAKAFLWNENLQGDCFLLTEEVRAEELVDFQVIVP